MIGEQKQKRGGAGAVCSYGEKGIHAEEGRSTAIMSMEGREKVVNQQIMTMAIERQEVERGVNGARAKRNKVLIEERQNKILSLFALLLWSSCSCRSPYGIFPCSRSNHLVARGIVCRLQQGFSLKRQDKSLSLCVLLLRSSYAYLMMFTHAVSLSIEQQFNARASLQMLLNWVY